jgi:DNA-binding NarL/FixJ family response regulator
VAQSQYSAVVLVFDDKALRRAALTQVVSEWADANELAVCSCGPAEVLTRFQAEIDCRMIIFSVGSDRVTDRRCDVYFKVLRALVPDAPLIVASEHADFGEVESAIAAGARGYIPMDVDPEQALRALSFVLDGGTYLPADVLMPAASNSDHGGTGGHRSTSNMGSKNEPRTADDDDIPDNKLNGASDAKSGACEPDLTCRQGEVVNLVHAGLSNKLIARQLGMSEATVKAHLRQVMRKSGARNRTQVALHVRGRDRHNGMATDSDREVANQMPEMYANDASRNSN